MPIFTVFPASPRLDNARQPAARPGLAPDGIRPFGQRAASRRLDKGLIQGVQISIVDTGVGIPQEDMAQIFKPFWTTKGTKGTGLGLAISHGIVRSHGGEIWAESKAGQGSAFYVFLPERNTI